MRIRVTFVLISVMFAVPVSGVELLGHTSQSGGEILRLMRNDKLDLVLPGAMRDNGVDMWIHVTRQGDPDPMAMQFGTTYGYL